MLVYSCFVPGSPLDDVKEALIDVGIARDPESIHVVRDDGGTIFRYESEIDISKYPSRGDKDDTMTKIMDRLLSGIEGKHLHLAHSGSYVEKPDFFPEDI